MAKDTIDIDAVDPARFTLADGLRPRQLGSVGRLQGVTSAFELVFVGADACVADDHRAQRGSF